MDYSNNETASVIEETVTSQENTQAAQQASEPIKTKFCKYCGGRIPEDAVVCTLCGRQVEALNQGAQPQIIINNDNSSNNSNVNAAYAGGVAIVGRQKNKWIAFLLCLFLGGLGAHRFYEGKIATGILYLLTGGLCGIGIIVDLILILLKPNPYYVK